MFILFKGIAKYSVGVKFFGVVNLKYLQKTSYAIIVLTTPFSLLQNGHTKVLVAFSNIQHRLF